MNQGLINTLISTFRLTEKLGWLPYHVAGDGVWIGIYSLALKLMLFTLHYFVKKLRRGTHFSSN